NPANRGGPRRAKVLNVLRASMQEFRESDGGVGTKHNAAKNFYSHITTPSHHGGKNRHFFAAWRPAAAEPPGRLSAGEFLSGKFRYAIFIGGPTWTCTPNRPSNLRCSGSSSTTTLMTWPFSMWTIVLPRTMR